MGRRLDAERLSARSERSRCFCASTAPDRGGGPRPCQSRDRGLGVNGHWHGSRLGQGNPLLERGRSLASLLDDDVQPPPSQAHSGSYDGRPSGRTTTLPFGGRRPALASAVPTEVPLGGETAETGSAAREDLRIGLPAIFAAFFWLGVTSFGGKRRHGSTTKSSSADIG